MNPKILLPLGAIIIFGFVNWQIVAKERLRAGGQPIFLELAPIDPRSLMQGDYMALNFRVARDIQNKVSPEAGPGLAVLRLNDNRVGDFVRVHAGETLAPNEVRLRFKFRNGTPWLGTNAFFFHEGQEQRYRGARFGEFRVNADGDAMLVGLCDENVRPM